MDEIKQSSFIGQVWHLFDNGGGSILLSDSKRDDSQMFRFELSDVITLNPKNPLVEGAIVSFEQRLNNAVKVQALLGTRRIGKISHLNTEGFYCRLIDRDSNQELMFRFVEANVEPASRNQIAVGITVSYELRFEHPDIIPFNIKVVVPKKVEPPVIAQISITTQGSNSITSNKDYIKGEIAINGKSVYTDYKGTMKIRGRGNSTWGYPKKPFRIKLDAPSPLLGMGEAKDWVLLANYNDGIHTLNPVAFKIGQLLNMPFTNTMVPVELTINGEYQGLYMLTEQIEVQKNRVNIGENGVLLQLDVYSNEDYQFESLQYGLPVNIMYPKLKDLPEKIEQIQLSLEQLESLVDSPNFPNNDYLDYLDVESVVNYLLVYMLTANREINHPKSTFLYKTAQGKWTMGPIWDFDWAFNFDGNESYFTSPTDSLFGSSSSSSTRFFSKLMTDSHTRNLMKQKWTDFKANKLAELLIFIDEHTEKIKNARNEDYKKWQRGRNDFTEDVSKLKIWLENRANDMMNIIEES